MAHTSPDTGSRSPTKSAPEATPAVRRKISTTAAELMAERQGQLPVWIRSPKFGTEHFTGFTRSYLYLLASEGKIRSVSIRAPGQVKGVRLFNLQSLLDFVARCEASANAETEGGK